MNPSKTKKSKKPEKTGKLKNSEKSKKPIYAIAGPTASGKTALGVELARRLGGAEIINCDSVQIYEEIEIATAKPSVEEMRGVPHHLIGYVSPEKSYTAADWADDAARKIREIEKRGNIPILVGGTGFYLRTLREPLFEAPKTDEKLRRRFDRLRERKGAEHLYEILRRIDPESAEKLFPRDYPRVQRALEVYFQTGEKLSVLQTRRKPPPAFARRIEIFVLDPPRERLYEIINRRTERHFEAGLIEEVENLLAKGLSDATGALGAHGYRRVCEYLRGERTRASALEKTRQDVRNYAKRQLSWFRREKEAIWLQGFGSDRATLEKLLEILELK